MDYLYVIRISETVDLAQMFKWVLNMSTGSNTFPQSLQYYPAHGPFILLLVHLLYLLGNLAGLHVHQQISLLYDIHRLANPLYHHHHYNSRIVPREAVHN